MFKFAVAILFALISISLAFPAADEVGRRVVRAAHIHHRPDCDGPGGGFGGFGGAGASAGAGGFGGMPFGGGPMGDAGAGANAQASANSGSSSFGK